MQYKISFLAIIYFFVLSHIGFAQKIPSFNAIGPICSGDNTVVLPTVSNNGFKGTWSPNFDNSKTLTYTFIPTKYINVSSGGSHSIGLKSDGTLWAWGRNNFGQLGTGDKVDQFEPVQIGTDTDWKLISAGVYHTMAVKNDGSLWTWGQNDFGQLGNNNKSTVLTPQKISNSNNWGDISAGYSHSLAIKTDGTLWSWGDNADFKLGDSTLTESLIPIQITSGTNWAQVSAGSIGSFALKSNGTLWSWGNGDLGNASVTEAKSPMLIGTDSDWSSVSVGDYNVVAMKTNGSIWHWGNSGVIIKKYDTPQKIGVDLDWQSIDAGFDYFLATKKDGTLWAWGTNGNAEYGNGTYNSTINPTKTGTATDWTYISAGYVHSFGIKSDGSLWAWGGDQFGQLGVNNGDNLDKLTPFLVGAVNTSTLTVTVKPKPVIVSTTDGSICGSGKINLLASSDLGTVNWYADTLLPSVANGNSFTTTSLSNSKYYYVDATYNGCTSVAKTKVLALVKNVPKVLNVTANSRCGAGTLTLSATADVDSVNWFSDTLKPAISFNKTFITPVLSSTQKYFVEATFDGCKSTSKSMVLATIKNTSASSFSKTVCDSYLFNGISQTKSGVYKDTLVNAVGCDSVITLNLTIKQKSAYSFSKTVCDSYLFNGISQTKSGVYKDTLVNAVGCDSVITLNLTVKQKSVYSFSKTVCDSYLFNGISQTKSGVYKDTLVNAAGCDSVISLNLTIKQKSAYSFSKTVCDSYLFNGISQTKSGVYKDTLVNAVGCDSVITLNLTINQINSTVLNKTASQSYIFNKLTLTKSGIYKDTLTNILGCDSIVTLYLTIDAVSNTNYYTKSPKCKNGLGKFVLQTSSNSTGPFVVDIVKTTNQGSSQIPSQKIDSIAYFDLLEGSYKATISDLNQLVLSTTYFAIVDSTIAVSKPVISRADTNAVLATNVYFQLTAKNVTLGNKVHWFTNGFISVLDSSINSKAYLTDTSSGNVTIKAIAEDKQGCMSDTSNIFVQYIQPVIISNLKSNYISIGDSLVIDLLGKMPFTVIYDVNSKLDSAVNIYGNSFKIKTTSSGYIKIISIKDASGIVSRIKTDTVTVVSGSIAIDSISTTIPTCVGKTGKVIVFAQSKSILQYGFRVKGDLSFDKYISKSDTSLLPGNYQVIVKDTSGNFSLPTDFKVSASPYSYEGIVPTIYIDQKIPVELLNDSSIHIGKAIYNSSFKADNYTWEVTPKNAITNVLNSVDTNKFHWNNNYSGTVSIKVSGSYYGCTMGTATLNLKLKPNFTYRILDNKEVEVTTYGLKPLKLIYSTDKVKHVQSNVTTNIRIPFNENQIIKLLSLIDNSGDSSIYPNIEIEKKYIAAEFYNGFSPNGDGVNDTLKVLYYEFDVRSSTFEVFDFNGFQVYLNNNFKGKWDGRDLKGNILPSGYYYYVFTDYKGNNTTNDIESQIRKINHDNGYSLPLYARPRGFIEIRSGN